MTPESPGQRTVREWLEDLKQAGFVVPNEFTPSRVFYGEKSFRFGDIVVPPPHDPGFTPLAARIDALVKQERARGLSAVEQECRDYRWRNRVEHGYTDAKPCRHCDDGLALYALDRDGVGVRVSGKPVVTIGHAVDIYWWPCLLVPQPTRRAEWKRQKLIQQDAARPRL